MKRRSVLLVVDNCPSHPRVKHLTNVTLKFLPPNTSSKTQPLDQGVIKTIKAEYRTQLLQWVIRKTEVTSSSVEVTSTPESINALDAALWISSCWNKVQPEAVRKCFRRAGFVKDQEDDVELRPDSLTREAEIEGVDFQNFVVIDDEVTSSTEPNPQAIFQSILAEAGVSVEASSSGDDAEESDDETEMVQKLKEEDVGRVLAQVSCFAAENAQRC
ncbi:hypothetical protein M514_22737 [Trichuris suis]|uniref:DDE-1 domain-containing protein n=1 Tax=Trichuris suis TaxID=68888 RepID=A0A085N6C4_9BILA|nr:hypothetical protein M514_22737 [Trichuris suis]